MRDGLGRVDDAAAADSEDEVCLEGERLADALAHERDARIRLDAAEDLEGEASGRQLALDAREQAAPDDAAATVDDVDAAHAVRAQLLGHAVLGMAAEDDLGRHLEFKTLHKKTPCICLAWIVLMYTSIIGDGQRKILPPAEKKGKCLLAANYPIEDVIGEGFYSVLCTFVLYTPINLQ